MGQRSTESQHLFFSSGFFVLISWSLISYIENIYKMIKDQYSIEKFDLLWCIKLQVLGFVKVITSPGLHQAWRVGCQKMRIVKFYKIHVDFSRKTQENIEKIHFKGQKFDKMCIFHGFQGLVGYRLPNTLSVRCQIMRNQGSFQMSHHSSGSEQ